MHGEMLVVEKSGRLVNSVKLLKDVSAESGLDLVKIGACCFIVQARCLS